MSASVNFENTLSIINELIKLKSIDNFNIPVMLWGNHGVGKTSLVRQLSESSSKNCVILNLATQSPEDLLGQIDGKGGYHLPNWVSRDSKGTIYFLDELNRAPGYVLQCMFNFILEGRLHTNTIVGKSDIVISACNPPNENYTVTEFDDKAFLSRFLHLKVQPEKHEFCNFITKKYKNAIIQTCLANSKEMYQEKPFDINWQGSCDNRNLERISYIIDNSSKEFINKFGMIVFSGLVGYDAASIILNEYREFNNVNFHTIAIDGKLDFQSSNVSLVNSINNSAISWIKENAKSHDPKIYTKNLFAYIKYIPKDLQVSFLKGLKSLDNELFNTIITMDIDYFMDLITTI
jgi:hypothetical protein